MTAGRPKLFKSEAELESAVIAYFSQFDGSEDPEHPKHKKAPNLFGLCRNAGMSYDAYTDYASGDYDTETEKFSVPCEKARLMVLEYAGEMAYTHTAGAVFNTINNTRTFKQPWKNAQHQEVTGPNNGPLSIQITQNQAGIA